MLNPSDVAESITRSEGAVEEGEIDDDEVVKHEPAPPSKRRRCGRESLIQHLAERPVKSHMSAQNIIWVDLEMTGLDLSKDTIMEMACIVTDRQLNIISEGPNLIIHHTDDQLNAMGAWCTEQHGRTGLTKACRDSVLTVQDVEEAMLDFVKHYCPKGRCELAGNSIHCDRKFIEKYMPNFLEHLHYRIIDVSSVRNVASRWYPDFDRFESTEGNHRALNDIRSSISEMLHYKKTVFKSRTQYTADLSPQVPLDDLFSQYARKKKDDESRQAQQAAEDNGVTISDHSLGVESEEGVLGKSPIRESLKLFGDF